MFFNLSFSSISAKQYKKLDASIKLKIKKKILQLKKQNKKRRHLRFGVPYFVEEIGQYRVIYNLDEIKKEITILFLGKHKNYENYLKKLE